jgi:hypothetical protein
MRCRSQGLGIRSTAGAALGYPLFAQAGRAKNQRRDLTQRGQAFLQAFQAYKERGAFPKAGARSTMCSIALGPAETIIWFPAGGCISPWAGPCAPYSLRLK